MHFDDSSTDYLIELRNKFRKTLQLTKEELVLDDEVRFVKDGKIIWFVHRTYPSRRMKRPLGRVMVHELIPMGYLKNTRDLMLIDDIYAILEGDIEWATKEMGEDFNLDKQGRIVIVPRASESAE